MFKSTPSTAFPVSAMLQTLGQVAWARHSGLSIACVLFQLRAFGTLPARLATGSGRPSPARAPSPAPAPTDQQQKPPPEAADEDEPSKPSGPLAYAPRSYGERTEEFTPTPLSRPIGMPAPPLAGENTGLDHRSLRQRRDDFVNYAKHIVRREELYVETSPLDTHSLIEDAT